MDHDLNSSGIGTNENLAEGGNFFFYSYFYLQFCYTAHIILSVLKFSTLHNYYQITFLPDIFLKYSF